MTDAATEAARLLRPGRDDARELRRDRLWLLLLGLALFATGLGFRDPWPADEPRFALIARDMVASGQWLFPSIGGDWYQDKPPVFFWMISLCLLLVGRLDIAFLLPSLLGAIGTLLLVHDLGRRVWSREAGFAAALLLAGSLQFTFQARAAQIDMLLVFWSTLSLYGIARHLLLGPDWRAYALGGFAAGIGVITKGVGFLPLLLPLVFAALRGRRFNVIAIDGGWRWALALLGALVAIGLWLVPMLLAVAFSNDATLAAYRDEILFKQTAGRYAQAWHHHAPWYYFLVSVIPGLWLPLTALLPWLVPAWRDAARARDPRSWLFLGWVFIVVLFFSLSAGKRGVYVLPALPALALAAAPVLADRWHRAGVQRVGFALSLALGIVVVLAWVFLAFIRPDRAAELSARYDVTSITPLVVAGGGVVIVVLLLGVARGLLGWIAALVVVFAVQGYWVNPMLDGVRSGREFVARVEAAVPPGRTLGFAGYREQFLLHLQRPVWNFGHARWREGRREAEDAARWLSGAPDRVLLVDDELREDCFSASPRIDVGFANRIHWSLVGPPADPDCVAAGRPEAARLYTPPPRSH